MHSIFLRSISIHDPSRLLPEPFAPMNTTEPLTNISVSPDEFFGKFIVSFGAILIYSLYNRKSFYFHPANIGLTLNACS
jgi:hypothetical protein